MSVAAETSSPEHSAASSACASCGSPLATDQEWCLECGAAQTLIHRAPDWRVALAIVATVVLLALIGLAIVLVNLSNNANRAAVTVTTTAPAPPAATATQPAATAQGPATFLGWPVGLSGWTVVLARNRNESIADAAASGLAADGIKVGVLDTSQHPSLPPGFWYVFSGRYPDRARARAAAATLRQEGQPTARAVRVAKPGGL